MVYADLTFTQQGHLSFTFFRGEIPDHRGSSIHTKGTLKLYLLQRKKLPDPDLTFTQQGHPSFSFFRGEIPDHRGFSIHRDNQALPFSEKNCQRWTSTLVNSHTTGTVKLYLLQRRPA
jgi:hypothetical protein